MSSVASKRDLLLAMSRQFFASPAGRSAAYCLCLMIATFLVYAPVRQNSFINFDDIEYLTQNTQVSSGLHWETVKWAFGTTYAANWHPVTWLSHALDCQMFGLNPAGHHLVGVLLHSVNVVLLFLVLQSFTGFTWRSLMVAALFSVHTLNVESVAWASERKNLLSMLFVLLALWAYRAYVSKLTLTSYLSVAGLFLLALMAKPQVITFPFLLLLVDYWPLARLRFDHDPGDNSARATVSWLIIEKVPFFLLSAFSAFMTVYAQRDGHAVRSTYEFSVLIRLENAIVAYCQYLRDAFWPHHLAIMYPHPGSSLDIWQVAACAILVLAISAVAIAGGRGSLAVGWLWFLGTLVPMIGLVQVGMQGRADRYTYLPMVGIFILAVWAIADLASRWKIRAAWLATMAGLVLAALGANTYNQIGYWRNSETLWTHTLQVTSANFMAESNLAQYLAHQGRNTEALVHFHNALVQYDWGAPDLINFGTYEQRHGYTADAVAQFQRALGTTNDVKLRTAALCKMGSAYLDLKQGERAERSFDQALQADPNNPSALIGVGVFSHRRGDLNLAISRYRKAISQKPSGIGFWLLGKALEQSGKSQEAHVAYSQAQQFTTNLDETRTAAERWLSQ